MAAGVGAVGAVVSVMSRMTFGKLSLDYEAGRWMLIVLGVFRPAIGMVFGVALWVRPASGALGIGPKDRALMPFFSNPDRVSGRFQRTLGAGHAGPRRRSDRRKQRHGKKIPKQR
jgi:hypothetical protein